MSKRKNIELNIKFKNGIVECAKSPEICKNCKEYCELMELFYYPFNYKDVIECIKNDERGK